MPRTQTALPALLAALLVVLPLPALRADEVVKTDGSVIHCIILEEGARRLTVLTVDGKVTKLPVSRLESWSTGLSTGIKALDEQLAEVDDESASEIFAVAKKAKEEKRKAWRLIAQYALRVNPDHGDTRRMLGHIEFEGDWFDDPKDIRKHMRKQGYVQLEVDDVEAWVDRKERSKVKKNKDEWMVDEVDGLSFWKLKDEVLPARGYEKLNGHWFKPGSETDKSEMKVYKDTLGETVIVYSTKHFTLYVQEYSPPDVMRLGELCEQARTWALDTLQQGANVDPFRGNKALMYAFRDKSIVQKWYSSFAGRLGLDGQVGKLIDTGSGNVSSPMALWACHVVGSDGERLENQLVNHAANMVLQRFSPGLKSTGTESWLSEAWGLRAEHELLGNGIVLHSTLAKYDGDGGRASKQFTTQDSQDRIRGILREGSDLDLAQLNKIELNQLSGDHVAQSYAILVHLIENHQQAMVEWLTKRNLEETIKAFEANIGEKTPVYMDTWRKWVRSWK